MIQVRQVIVAQGGDAAEAAGIPADVGKPGKALRVQLIPQREEQIADPADHGAHLIQFDAGKGHGLIVRIGLHIGIHDGPADGVPLRLLRCPGQEAVVPPDGRLRLLAGDHIPGIIRADVGGFHGGHHAGVKANPVQRPLRAEGAGVQGFRQLAQGQLVPPEELIVADALHGAAAVVPEDEGIVLGGIVGNGPGEEGGQGFRLPHIGQGETLQHPHALLPQLQQGQLPGVEPQMPGFRASGQDQDIHPGKVAARGHHLPDIRGGRAVLGFQVAARHVDHQRERLFPLGPCRASEDSRQAEQQRPENQDLFDLHACSGLSSLFFCIIPESPRRWQGILAPSDSSATGDSRR